MPSPLNPEANGMVPISLACLTVAVIALYVEFHRPGGWGMPADARPPRRMLDVDEGHTTSTDPKGW